MYLAKSGITLHGITCSDMPYQNVSYLVQMNKIHDKCIMKVNYIRSLYQIFLPSQISALAKVLKLK